MCHTAGQAKHNSEPQGTSLQASVFFVIILCLGGNRGQNSLPVTSKIFEIWIKQASLCVCRLIKQLRKLN